MSDHLKKIQGLVGEGVEASQPQHAGALAPLPLTAEQEEELKQKRIKAEQQRKEHERQQALARLTKLEQAGYDYDGREAWRGFMRRMGRAR